MINWLGNRPHPSDAKPLFAEDDPRLQFTVSEVDPRIHFALVCGAKVVIRVFPYYYFFRYCFLWTKYMRKMGRIFRVIQDSEGKKCSKP